jgi:hypothetical protein
MKTKVVMLPLVAFLFALVTAFAAPFFQGAGKGIRPSDSQCVAGILIPPTGFTTEDCLTTNNTNRCLVRISDEGDQIVVPAFDNGSASTCAVPNEELYAQFVQQ